MQYTVPWYAVYSIQYIVCSMQHTVYNCSMQYTVYSMQYTRYRIPQRRGCMAPEATRSMCTKTSNIQMRLYAVVRVHVIHPGILYEYRTSNAACVSYSESSTEYSSLRALPKRLLQTICVFALFGTESIYKNLHCETVAANYCCGISAFWLETYDECSQAPLAPEKCSPFVTPRTIQTAFIYTSGLSAGVYFTYTRYILRYIY